jgi:hypothetical protein
VVPEKLAVSTLNSGFGLPMGLRMGDSGFAEALGVSEDMPGVDCCDSRPGEGPVTQDTMASPNGPTRQFVPGALVDLSWPKFSCESWRRGGLPGIVAREYQLGWSC